MSPTSISAAPLAKKLQLRPGSAILLRHAPQAAREALTPLPDGSRIVADTGEHADTAIVFVSRQAQLEAELPGILQRLAGADPLLWFAYPKTGQLETDLTRDRGWDALIAAGWRGVRQVAIDGVWSALRWRRV
jgi:hypothetical protein